MSALQTVKADIFVPSNMIQTVGFNVFVYKLTSQVVLTRFDIFVIIFPKVLGEADNFYQIVPPTKPYQVFGKA